MCAAAAAATALLLLGGTCADLQASVNCRYHLKNVLTSLQDVEQLRPGRRVTGHNEIYSVKTVFCNYEHYSFEWFVGTRKILIVSVPTNSCASFTKLRLNLTLPMNTEGLLSFRLRPKFGKEVSHCAGTVGLVTRTGSNCLPGGNGLVQVVGRLEGGDQLRPGQRVSGQCRVFSKISIHAIEWSLNNKLITSCNEMAVEGYVYNCTIDKEIPKELVGTLVCKTTYHRKDSYNTDKMDYCTDEVAHVTETVSSSSIFPEDTTTVGTHNEIAHITSEISASRSLLNPEETAVDTKGATSYLTVALAVLAGCLALLLAAGGWLLRRRGARPAPFALRPPSPSPCPPRPVPPPPDSTRPPAGYEWMRPAVVPIYDLVKQELAEEDTHEDNYECILPNGTYQNVVP